MEIFFSEKIIFFKKKISNLKQKVFSSFLNDLNPQNHPYQSSLPSTAILSLPIGVKRICRRSMRQYYFLLAK